MLSNPALTRFNEFYVKEFVIAPCTAAVCTHDHPPDLSSSSGIGGGANGVHRKTLSFLEGGDPSLEGTILLHGRSAEELMKVKRTLKVSTPPSPFPPPLSACIFTVICVQLVIFALYNLKYEAQFLAREMNSLSPEDMYLEALSSPSPQSSTASSRSSSAASSPCSSPSPSPRNNKRNDNTATGQGWNAHTAEDGASVLSGARRVLSISPALPFPFRRAIPRGDLFCRWPVLSIPTSFVAPNFINSQGSRKYADVDIHAYRTRRRNS